MIRRNSSWLTTPSPSRSASSIISWKNVLVASNVQGFGSNLLLWKTNSQMWNSIQFYPKLFTQQKLEFRCLKDELEKLHLKPVEWIMLNLWFAEFISIIKSFPKGWLPVILHQWDFHRARLRLSLDCRRKFFPYHRHRTTWTPSRSLLSCPFRTFSSTSSSRSCRMSNAPYCLCPPPTDDSKSSIFIFLQQILKPFKFNITVQEDNIFLVVAVCVPLKSWFSRRSYQSYLLLKCSIAQCLIPLCQPP